MMPRSNTKRICQGDSWAGWARWDEVLDCSEDRMVRIIQDLPSLIRSTALVRPQEAYLSQKLRNVPSFVALMTKSPSIGVGLLVSMWSDVDAPYAQLLRCLKLFEKVMQPFFTV
jgi:hypothetical protein